MREQFALAEDLLPEQLRITTILDESVTVQNMLSELLNNVLTAVVLVLIVVVAVMGWRMALLVGLTIPGAFLTGILLVWAFGFTLNIVVLFALILVAGMLVDGAIVVSELADRLYGNDTCRVHPAAVLAGRGGPIHEVPAGYGDSMLAGLTGHGAGVFTYARPIVHPHFAR